MTHTLEIGWINVTFGWIWMNLGFISGFLMAVKAEPFAVPASRHTTPWLGDYEAIPRRLVRLGHIAFIMLSVVNILFGMHIDATSLSPEWKRVGAYSILFGGAGVPVLCFAAALHRPLAPWIGIPAFAVLLGNLIIAWGFATL